MEGKLGEGALIYSMPPGKSSVSYQAPGHEATSRCGEDKAFWAVGKVSRESWVKTGVGWTGTGEPLRGALAAIRRGRGGGEDLGFYLQK